MLCPASPPVAMLMVRATGRVKRPLPMDDDRTITVLGSGPFGLIISSLLSQKVERVQLWYPDAREAGRLRNERVGRVLDRPYKLHEHVEVVSGFDVFRKGAQCLFVVLPSRQFEDTLEKVFEHLDDGPEHLIVVMTKGLVSRPSRKKYGVYTFSRFVEELAVRQHRLVRVAVVNGPSLLAEIHSSHFTFFNIGCVDADAVRYLRDLLNNEFVQTAASPDVPGVELGGILKNPVAIALGMAEGLPQSGSNLQGVLLSQGFREMFRLAVRLGAKPNTLLGVSGLADLVTTATSPNSRNRAYGLQFARKVFSHQDDPGFLERVELLFRPTHFIEQEVLESQHLVEGAFALAPILEIAEELELRMPLFQTIFQILSRKKKPDALIRLFGSQLAGPAGDGDSPGGRRGGVAFAAGHSFHKLIQQRIFHHVIGSRGMLDRVQKQSSNILSNLNRRLERARRKKNRREMEAIPEELQYWKRLHEAAPGHARAIIEDLIRYYVDEISDNYKPAMRGMLTRTLAPLRWIVSGMYRGAAIPHVGGGVEDLKLLANRYNILYAPVHRSHLDSVEVAFGLSWRGLPVPRYAAGINLMTSPFMSWVLKSLGAYAVDRERTRNILYLECLTRYSTMMLEVGIPSLVYPEGTRSRTGGIGVIKTGLLSTAVDAYTSSGSEILVVPLALSYENVPEDDEFTDRAKFTGFRKFLKVRTKVYLDVCEPIRVSRFIHEEDPTHAIAIEITRAWQENLRILPNQIIARLLVENDYEIQRDDLEGLIDQFIESNSGNYLTRSASRIARRGLRILKKRRLIQMKRGKITGTERGPLNYYAAMIPPSPHGA